MIFSEIKNKISPILKKYRIKKAEVFGSYATQTHSEKSDIDILVEVEQKTSLLDFIGIKNELEDALGIRVDLVEYRAIKSALKENILRTTISLL